MFSQVGGKSFFTASYSLLYSLKEILWFFPYLELKSSHSTFKSNFCLFIWGLPLDLLNFNTWLDVHLPTIFSHVLHVTLLPSKHRNTREWKSLFGFLLLSQLLKSCSGIYFLKEFTYNRVTLQYNKPSMETAFDFFNRKIYKIYMLIMTIRLVQN